MGKCELCGEPMPAGEESFRYHGFSGSCPKPPLPMSAASKTKAVEELSALVLKFDMLELPGQPKAMHMGTANLVHDLLGKARELEAENAELRFQLSAGVAIVLRGVDLMTADQVGKWEGVRAWLEQDADQYQEQSK